MKIGIDAISFSTSQYMLPLSVLASQRGVDCEKYHTGIGQIAMSVFPHNEDIVTIAVDAADKVVSKLRDKSAIDLVIFATESAVDLSKSTGLYVHYFLGLADNCRVLDIKQACYSVTAALRLAEAYIATHPQSKVLIVGSDIVKYSKNTSGEPTQGGAAVAMIVSQNPRMLEIESAAGVYSSEVMDFWRPTYATEAFFDGKLSAYSYLKSLDICFKRYLENAHITANDIDFACFHAPFGKMAQKANKSVFAARSIEPSLEYGKMIGNSCSASLYVCLISLLDNIGQNISDSRIGMFSYGSGSVGEYFSMRVVDGYDEMLTILENQRMLSDRVTVSFEEYEKFRSLEYNRDMRYKNVGRISFAGIDNDKRQYVELLSC